MNVMLQSANLPNKQEIDDVYRELHSLRKRISKLESKLRAKNGSFEGLKANKVAFDRFYYC